MRTKYLIVSKSTEIYSEQIICTQKVQAKLRWPLSPGSTPQGLLFDNGLTIVFWLSRSRNNARCFIGRIEYRSRSHTVSLHKVIDSRSGTLSIVRLNILPKQRRLPRTPYIRLVKYQRIIAQLLIKVNICMQNQATLIIPSFIVKWYC